MEPSRFTPGPWMAAAKPSGVVGWPVVSTGNGRSICTVSFAARQPGEDELWLDRQINRESAANARLIAAAPDMYAALQLSEEANEARAGDPARALGLHSKALAARRAAIAKAEGR